MHYISVCMKRAQWLIYLYLWDYLNIYNFFNIDLGKPTQTLRGQRNLFSKQFSVVSQSYLGNWILAGSFSSFSNKSSWR